MPVLAKCRDRKIINHGCASHGRGATSVLGYPVPRTAAHYFLNDDCELLEYGLTVSGTTGELMLADGCNTVGCGSTEPFSVTCTVTAQQNIQSPLDEIQATPITGDVETISWFNAALEETLVFTDSHYIFTSLGGYDEACIYVRGQNNDMKTTQPPQAGFCPGHRSL